MFTAAAIIKTNRETMSRDEIQALLLQEYAPIPENSARELARRIKVSAKIIPNLITIEHGVNERKSITVDQAVEMIVAEMKKGSGKFTATIHDAVFGVK